MPAGGCAASVGMTDMLVDCRLLRPVVSRYSQTGLVPPEPSIHDKTSLQNVMAQPRREKPVSTISRVAIHAFGYELENFGHNMMTYVKGGRLPVTKFVTVIETDDGLRGEFAPHYMANQMTCAQVSQMAPMLIGRNAEHRGRIFEDLKNAFRHFDRAGIAAIDGALWDLAGKNTIARSPDCSAGIATGYRRMPAHSRARRQLAGWIVSKPMQILHNIALNSAIRPSRSMASGTASRKAKFLS